MEKYRQRKIWSLILHDNLIHRRRSIAAAIFVSSIATIIDRIVIFAIGLNYFFLCSCSMGVQSQPLRLCVPYHILR